MREGRARAEGWNRVEQGGKAEGAQNTQIWRFMVTWCGVGLPGLKAEFLLGTKGPLWTSGTRVECPVVTVSFVCDYSHYHGGILYMQTSPSSRPVPLICQ
jgi:hypothetical protein